MACKLNGSELVNNARDNGSKAKRTMMMNVRTDRRKLSAKESSEKN